MALEEYIVKGGRKLRLGVTTGTCAAAAAKAAASMLLTGERISQVRLKTPKGLEVLLEVEDIRFFPELPADGSAELRDETAALSDGSAGPGDPFSAPLHSGEDSGGIHLAPRSLSAVSCAVRKDSGDDPDITNHALIYAEVRRVKNLVDTSFFTPEVCVEAQEGERGDRGRFCVSSFPRKQETQNRPLSPPLSPPLLRAAWPQRVKNTAGRQPPIRIEGGEGVGRVTKPGLDQPVGHAAINSTPRRMIEEAVREVLEGIRLSASGECTGDQNGYEVIISVPQGRELAAKTFNPRLGIVGGISILGTSGIVEPMSDQALLDTIRVEIRVRKEEGLTILPVAPGNYGRNFFLEKYGFSLDTSVTSSNFIYDTVKMAADAGFTKMLFVGHIGKLVKVAGGIRNTHSQYGDHRMEILTEIAESVLFGREKVFESETDGRLPAGLKEEASHKKELFKSLRRALADCVMTDEAIRILQEYRLAGRVLSETTRRIREVMQGWAQGRMQVEVVVFSNVHGELGRTEEALEFMRILQEQISE